MKSKKLTEIKVGIFVVVILFLFGVGVFIIGSHQKYFQRQYTLWASFSNIQGLIAGAPVSLAGLTVGRVNAIIFPEDPRDKTIKVELKIKKGIQKRIREDSIASIQTMGLLGDKYVEISLGSPEKNILQDGDRITTSSPFDLLAYAAKLEEAIDVINTILIDVREISSQVRGGKGLLHAILYDPAGGELVNNLSSAAQSANNIVKKVEQGEGTLGGIINDPTVYEDLKVILGGAKRSTVIKGLIHYTIKKKKAEQGEEPAK
ncbi:MAG: MlaD family protein [Desulfobacterales bacterium]|nr:MlaD family protein [Desulfobacterales bacterium]